MYYEGEYFQQDYRKAIEWYQKSASLGYRAAQYKLGYMYEKGEGTRPDCFEAIEWYKKAANQGHEDAAIRLERIMKNIDYSVL